MKQKYIDKITKLLKESNDLELLEIIYQILVKSSARAGDENG